MMEQLHKSQQSDEEDDDLELLRLEALKTIHNKKEAIASSQISSYHSPIQTRSITVPNSYKLSQVNVTHLNVYCKSNSINENINRNMYYPPAVHLDNNLPTARPMTNHLNSYDASQILEKLDINEPYVPQHVSSMNANVGGSTISSDNWAADSITMMGNGFLSYVPPHKGTDSVIIGVGNVQLSPRSMAFVAKNNDILMRRKGEKSNYESNYNRSPCTSPNYRASPNYRPFSPGYRTPSPSYRSPGRWSHSPSLKSKSRSPISRNRQHSYVHRRSSSRSPLSGPRSPIFRRKTLSKSPSRTVRHPSPPPYNRFQSKSPLPNSKRGKSRSPLPAPRHKVVSPSRRISRSPNLSSRYPRSVSRSPPPANNGRKRSPQVLPRFSNRSRANSPSHPKHPSNFRTNNSGDSAKHISQRSKSPINQSTNNNLHRKSLSPRVRSRTRSPARKYQRRSRERNTQTGRRRSPYDRKVRRRNDLSMNGFRNRIRKRSCSPINNSRRKRSRTKTPERSRRDDNRYRKYDKRKPEENIRNDRRDEIEKSFEDKHRNNQSEANRRDNKICVDQKNDKIDVKEKKIESKDHKIGSKSEKDERIKRTENKSKDESLTPVKEIEKEQDEEEGEGTKKKKTDEIQMKTSSSDEKNDSSDDDDDGIDLFPSDESESENEGRFKLSSGKNERKTQVTTLSFTKLGESLIPPVVKDLQEVTATTSRSNSVKSDRDRGGRLSDFDSRRRGDKFKKSDSSRNHRNSDRRRSNRSNISSRKDREDTFKSEEKRSENRPMFKSTFTVVENEVVKSNGKLSADKDINDKKNNSKKKLQNKIEKESLETDTTSSPSEKLASTVSVLNTNISSSSPSSTSPSAGKKPIHLRLGAMTNTFKTPKKSSGWTPEKV